MKYSFFKKTVGSLSIIECPGDQGAPAIVMCHGYGASADNFLFICEFCRFDDMRPTWIFPHGIINLEHIPGGKAWFHLDVEKLVAASENLDGQEAAASASRILAGSQLYPAAQAIDALVQEYKQKHPKVFLGGFSQGCMVSAQVGLMSSNPPDGLLLLSGAFVENQNWEELATKQTLKAPFILSHGRFDDILPYKMGEKLYSFYTASGFKGKMVPFNGSHEINDLVIREMQATLTSWMNAPS